MERIQEQSAVSDLVTSVESSPVPLLHAVEYVKPEPRVPAPQLQEQVIVQGIPRAQVGERIQQQIAKTISQETVQQRIDEQIVAVAAPCAATASPAPPMSMIGHAMLTPVDVYTKTAPVIEPMAAPVIEYIAPSPAFSSVDRLNGVVNPQFSIAADETSQMTVQEIPELQVLERIQEQIVGTISQENIQQRVDEQTVVVRAPRQVSFAETTVIYVPFENKGRKPSLRKSSKKKKKKNFDRTVQVMERIPEHTVVSFDQEEKLNNIKI